MPDAHSGETGNWYLIPAAYVNEVTGTLGVLEFGKDVPFEVRRVFWVFGVPDTDVSRGGHAHRALRQVLFCAKGRCVIDLESRTGFKESVELRERGPALFLNGPVWRSMHGFSGDCSMIVLCDREYSRDQVIRDRVEFFSNVQT